VVAFRCGLRCLCSVGVITHEVTEMHVSRLVCRVGGLLVAVVATSAPAMAQTITDGSVVFGSYFVYPATGAGYGAPPFAFGGAGFNYTSGTLSTSGAAGTVLNGQAVSAASLVGDDLAVFASATNANNSLAAAATWDTLNFGNLPALAGTVARGGLADARRAWRGGSDGSTA
jgi:hypothetical protein